jgi:hypothetical protein
MRVDYNSLKKVSQSEASTIAYFPTFVTYECKIFTKLQAFERARQPPPEGALHSHCRRGPRDHPQDPGPILHARRPGANVIKLFTAVIYEFS